MVSDEIKVAYLLAILIAPVIPALFLSSLIIYVSLTIIDKDYRYLIVNSAVAQMFFAITQVTFTPIFVLHPSMQLTRFFPYYWELHLFVNLEQKLNCSKCAYATFVICWSGSMLIITVALISFHRYSMLCLKANIYSMIFNTK